jgi:hypothetical protein
MKRMSLSISIVVVCMVLAVIGVFVFNIDHTAIADSSASQGTVNVRYQVVIPGENDGKPVSNMTITLLIGGYFDNNTNSNRVVGKADVPNNPLTSSNSMINGGAAYSFINLPALPDDEFYLLEVERNGRTWGEDGSVWEAGSIRVNNPFDDKHTFPIPQDIANGTLYGFVILNNGLGQIYENRLSGVNVTLYSCLPYDTSKGIVNTGIVDIPNNPQVTMSGDWVGMYRFDGLKPGFYNVTIEKDGLVGHRVINFTSDEENNNWNGNNIVLLQPPLAQVVETPTPYPIETATPQPVIISTPFVSASIRPSLSPKLPENITASTTPVTATPASTDGFQIMFAIMSLAIACNIIFYKLRQNKK